MKHNQQLKYYLEYSYKYIFHKQFNEIYIYYNYLFNKYLFIKFFDKIY